MFISNKLNVAQILSKKEILKPKKELIFNTEPQYDLTKFIEKEKISSAYNKYLFVK